MTVFRAEALTPELCRVVRLSPRKGGGGGFNNSWNTYPPHPSSSWASEAVTAKNALFW